MSSTATTTGTVSTLAAAPRLSAHVPVDAHGGRAAEATGPRAMITAERRLTGHLPGGADRTIAVRRTSGRNLSVVRNAPGEDRRDEARRPPSRRTGRGGGGGRHDFNSSSRRTSDPRWWPRAHDAEDDDLQVDPGLSARPPLNAGGSHRVDPRRRGRWRRRRRGSTAACRARPRSAAISLTSPAPTPPSCRRRTGRRTREDPARLPRQPPRPRSRDRQAR